MQKTDKHGETRDEVNNFEKITDLVVFKLHDRDIKREKIAREDVFNYDILNEIRNSSTLQWASLRPTQTAVK